MQNVTSLHQAFTSSVAPARIFKALFLEWQNLIPHLVPHGVRNIEIVKGDGGAGSIKETTFAEGGQVKTMKHKIDAMDKKNFIRKLSFIEGDILFDRLESVVYEVKLEPSANNGCICKIDCHHQPKIAVHPNERDIEMGRDKALGLFKVIEEYLIANPNVYA